jgi:hypothetical protein
VSALARITDQSRGLERPSVSPDRACLLVDGGWLAGWPWPRSEADGNLALGSGDRVREGPGSASGTARSSTGSSIDRNSPEEAKGRKNDAAF